MRSENNKIVAKGIKKIEEGKVVQNDSLYILIKGIHFLRGHSKRINQRG